MQLTRKFCPRCKIEKDISEFGTAPLKYNSSGYRSHCRVCNRVAHKIYWQKKTPDEKREASVKRWKWRGARKPDGSLFTPADYDGLFIYQDGKCGICRKIVAKIDLCVDHDHVTGYIRGLLCRFCNLGLGYFNDDIQLLDQVKNYLQKYRGQ